MRLLFILFIYVFKCDFIFCDYELIWHEMYTMQHGSRKKLRKVL